MNKEKRMSKKKRHVLIGVGISFVLIIAALLYYAFVITTAGQWFLSKFTPDTEQQQVAFSSALETTELIADEGFVLMKNDDNLLPLSTSENKKTKINLFGTRSVVTLFNSGGSTATNVESAIKVEDALRDEGNFELNDNLLNLYYNFYKTGDISTEQTTPPKNRSDSEILGESNNLILPELPASAFSDESLFEDNKTIIQNAKDYSDVAMIVLGRGGGEMQELSPKDLRLTNEEEVLIEEVSSAFDKVILVINSANVLQLDFLENYPSIKSVLWIGYPGESGTKSLARILNGTVNPSGRTVAMWPSDIMNNPAALNYMELNDEGEFISDGHYENAPEETGYFVQLHEGIYVGYKYYETRHNTDSSYNYQEEVVYPFGHGLSYTTFEKDILAINVEDDIVTVRVSVENTGDVVGKDVIQLYANPPYSGDIEKASANLIRFLKTNEMEPGQSDVYSFDIPFEDFASYDYKNEEAYVLEVGNYTIDLKDNSHDVLASETFNVGNEVVYSESKDGSRTSDVAAATNQFADALHIDDYLTRAWDENSRAFTGPQPDDYIASEEVLSALNYEVPTDEELGLAESDLPPYNQTLDETLMLEDMVGVSLDDPKWDTFVSQLDLEELTGVSGTGAYQLMEIERLGVPKTLNPDGTMAIASNIYSGPIMGVEGVGVTYPSPMVLASTWNKDIAYLMGTSVGNEAQGFGYSGWYAPAMNILRTPYNGRNFEYYSEDGTLAGEIAAGVVKGATDKGVITYVKHFALNERETGVRSSLFTWSNEQAIREIYLKPFEKAIKEGGSIGVMSSFNFIGQTWAGGHEGLLTNVLRNEWGFDGFVLTDAHMYPHMNVMQMLHAGGDVSLDTMAAWQGGRNHADTMLEFAEDENTNVSTIIALQKASKNVLHAITETWKMQE
ncbi:beta-glucosidase [Streptohalobacillus salinus]|uniref:Beta-glucosidase n=1 Tax=Streptohalobacillus salinus TaxID=621096 RepID=A0A2V3WES7_9BACI|nr:glycoside hydrolase family 3 N-terminal domain-containing protein [Streptohalobacillus salinus]PXW92098.1 beta-glucosidase [Streptohalobacillus salinus]